MTIFSLVSNKYFIVQSVGVTVSVYLCATRSSQLSEMRVIPLLLEINNLSRNVVSLNIIALEKHRNTTV